MSHEIAETDANLQEIARLRAMLLLANDLAAAVEAHHDMSRLVEVEPARQPELAAASYQLGAALAAYRQATKARSDALYTENMG